MCIRDSIYIVLASQFESFTEPFLIMLSLPLAIVGALLGICLLYTSDAADERSSVDLGGRRIIKKKTKAE